VEPETLIVSAVKKHEERASLVVRIWNPGSDAVTCRLAVKAPNYRPAHAYKTSLREERQAELALDELGRVSTPIHGKGLLTVELERVLGEREPTASDVPNLPYTGWVFREAMRLYPPAWGIAREALRDCEIGGYHVPRGTQLFLPQYVVHRDPRWFEDPGAFQPERWAGDLAKRLPRCAYFPFGDGPRVCIGNHFAMMEGILVLATIARRTAIDLHRREARRPTERLDDAAVAEIPDGVDQAFDVWAVRVAVDELPPLEREVIRLQHLESLTQAEISARLGVPVNTVKSRSFRAHRRLAARLGHLRRNVA
jgi:predicted DNA-binding protein (UPF0251 family)